MDRSLAEEARRLLDASLFPCSEEEISNMEVLDFGLGRPRQEGAQILTLASTDRLALKLIVLLPCQTEPEHRHLPNGDIPAKQEILRVVSGQMDVYTEGPGDPENAALSDGLPEYYTCERRTRLSPGEQILLEPPFPHWFRAGEAGCVALCVSTAAFDARDKFTNPNVKR